MKSPEKKMKEKAWKEFSKWIRRRDLCRSDNGYQPCITCGTVKHYKELQAGHFIAGRTNAILFDERGVHAQCYGCNVGRYGNSVEYFIYMEKRYDRDTIDDLRRLRNTTRKYTLEELEALRDKYADYNVGLDIKLGDI